MFIQIKTKSEDFITVLIDDIAFTQRDGQFFLHTAEHKVEITNPEMQNICNKLVAHGIGVILHEANGHLTQPTE